MRRGCSGAVPRGVRGASRGGRGRECGGRSLQEPVDRGVDVAARRLQVPDVGLAVEKAHVLSLSGWGGVEVGGGVR